MTEKNFDWFVVDAGGDDTVVGKSFLEVQRKVAQLRRQRLQRLRSADPDHRDLFARWSQQDKHVYAIRRTIVPLEGLLVIYLDAPSLDAMLVREAEMGAGRTELRNLRHDLVAGMVFGNHYSRLEPTGELGSTHVCDLIEISEAEFSYAAREGWPS